MGKIEFLLNGETVSLDGASPQRTLLDWLREDRGLTGTKEGCNEGDCGACTVMVTDEDGAKALNACILFLPQVSGKAVRTVEGLAGPDGALHPVQKAMVEHHGSQCGFCTPGFVMSMATAHLNGDKGHDDALAGNLCRCTGYASIVRAAQAAESEPVPEWVRDAPPGAAPADAALPRSGDELAAWCAANPDGTLIGGGTDVGLWATKGLVDLGKIAFTGMAADLRRIDESGDAIRIGACVTIAELMTAMAGPHPSFAELLRRFGSAQVRSAATIGGNIANGSPIGDGPPALIALGATLHLRRGAERRSIPLEEFFIEYGKQDRAEGEFVEAVSIPKQPDTLFCHKLSKRFDQDISTVCGCFNVDVRDGRVASARIAFGGMAGTPRRAPKAEAALTGRPWTEETVAEAREALAQDYEPMSDMRGSAQYRAAASQNLLERCFERARGHPSSVLEVSP